MNLLILEWKTREMRSFTQFLGVNLMLEAAVLTPFDSLPSSFKTFCSSPLTCIPDDFYGDWFLGKNIFFLLIYLNRFCTTKREKSCFFSSSNSVSCLSSLVVEGERNWLSFWDSESEQERNTHRLHRIKITDESFLFFFEQVVVCLSKAVLMKTKEDQDSCKDLSWRRGARKEDEEEGKDVGGGGWGGILLLNNPCFP